MALAFSVYQITLHWRSVSVAGVPGYRAPIGWCMSRDLSTEPRLVREVAIFQDVASRSIPQLWRFVLSYPLHTFCFLFDIYKLKTYNIFELNVVFVRETA